MKRLSMVSILFACATWAGIHALAAADKPAAGQPAAAENLPPLPTIPPPIDPIPPPIDVRETPRSGPLLQTGVERDGRSAAEPWHDPTRPSPIMRQLINPAKLPGQAKAPEIPAVELKARIIGGMQPGVAVLGIDKQTYVVNKGSEFSLAGPRYGGQKIRVMELDADVVRLEIQPTNLNVTLR